MKKVLNISQRALIAVVAAVALFTAWAMQSITSIIHKGLADASSIRVSDSASCVVGEYNVSEPHFSGCNSII